MRADARLELLGVLQVLSEDGALPPHREALRRRFEPWREHPVLAAIGAAAPGQERWMNVERFLLNLEGPPEFAVSGLEFPAGHSLLGVRDGLKDFVRASGFDAWFAAQPAPPLSIEGLNDCPAQVADYLGTPLKVRFEVLVASAFQGRRLNAVIRKADGWDVYAVLTREDLDDLAGGLAEDMRVTAWHELTHTVIDPLVEAAKSGFEASASLIEPLPQVARRGGWHETAGEHLVRAVTARLTERGLGAEAAARGLARDRRDGYIYMEPVLEALAAYESERGRFADIAAFFPTWIGVFDALARRPR